MKTNWDMWLIHKNSNSKLTYQRKTTKNERNNAENLKTTFIATVNKFVILIQNLVLATIVNKSITSNTNLHLSNFFLISLSCSKNFNTFLTLSLQKFW